jgi:hypothetical protein
MNVNAQPLLDRRRALELRAWVALATAALHEGGRAPTRLLSEMYDTGVAYLQPTGPNLRLRIAGVSSSTENTAFAPEVLDTWRKAALDRLAMGVR